MIERKFVAEKLKEFQIEEFVASSLNGAGHSKTKMQRTPLGEKIVIHASKPGLVVGKKGQDIRDLTKALKKEFNLENPQIEISEVENMFLDADVMAERIKNNLERFGSSKFKGIGHKVMADVMGAGALGVEILISGKIPSSRAKNWRFYQGYLKKCGEVALTGVYKSYTIAKLKTGVVGIKVSIMPSTTVLPDKVVILDEKIEEVEKISQEKEEKDKKKETKPKKKKKTTKKRKLSTDKEKGFEKPETSQKEAKESEKEPEEKVKTE